MNTVGRFHQYLLLAGRLVGSGSEFRTGRPDPEQDIGN